MNNRNDEWKALMAELEATPPELDYTLTRAKARNRKNGLRRMLAPVGALCGLLLSFALLVNVSPTFASACSGVPLLRELAAAVDFSPSLSAAIENDYFQPVDQEQTQNGVTCRVLGVIVDRRQLNIFFTLKGPGKEELGADMELTAADGTQLPSISYGGAWKGDENGIYQRTADFFEQDMPHALLFTVKAMADPERELASFTFHLEFDPWFTSQGETIEVGETFVIESQTLTVERIELYPTQMCIHVSPGPDNTALLKGLRFTVTDEKGNVYAPISNGLSAVGSPEGGYGIFMLESPYFQNSQSLELHITGADWLDQDLARVHVDLAAQRAEDLPAGVELLYARRSGTGWVVAFKGVQEGNKGNSHYSFHSIFGSTWYDAQGNGHLSEGGSHTIGWEDPLTGERRDEEETFTEELWLSGCTEDEVWLEPTYTGITELDEPIRVKLK